MQKAVGSFDPLCLDKITINARKGIINTKLNHKNYNTAFNEFVMLFFDYIMGVINFCEKDAEGIDTNIEKLSTTLRTHDGAASL
ncbi:MAG: hypothetical protein MHPSP_001549 [Paramarteilia canceri]